MLCPKCRKKLKTVNTACDDEQNEIIRERRCLYCGHRIYTIEFEAVDARASAEMWAIKNKNRRRKCES